MLAAYWESPMIGEQNLPTRFTVARTVFRVHANARGPISFRWYFFFLLFSNLLNDDDGDADDNSDDDDYDDVYIKKISRAPMAMAVAMVKKKTVNMTVKCVNCSINGYQVFLNARSFASYGCMIIDAYIYSLAYTHTFKKPHTLLCR